MTPQLDPATDARTRTSVQDVAALPSFDAAAEAVLACLSSTFGLDALARTGPRSYAVLCPETLEAVAQTIATDLVLRLHDAGLPASCGVAGTDLRDRDLAAAWHRAEQLRCADQGAAGTADVPAPNCAERSGCGPACR